MLERTKLAGKLFRNVKMKDVDFYVTVVVEYNVYGWWILRQSKNLADPKLDCIDYRDIIPKDWKEVKSLR